MNIVPIPERNDKGNVIGKFYPLQIQEILALKKLKILPNAAFVHLILRYENPFCDRPVILIPQEFALKWQVPESSVYEAIGKLKAAKIIKLHKSKISFDWANDENSDTESVFQDPRINSDISEKILESQNELQDPRINSDISEKILESQNELQDPRINSDISENQNSEPLPDKDSGTPQTLQTFSDLTDSLSEGDELTVESTKVVGEENMEGERENFSTFSEEENSEEEVETKIEVEQDLNSSGQLLSEKLPAQNVTVASLSKTEQPQIKPKNLSSRGKGFGACNTKNDNIKTTMPKTFKKLRRDFGYSEADCKEFEEFVHKKVAHFNPPIANYDDYLRSRLQGLVNDFDKTRAKKADSKRVTYVVVEAEDVPKKEPIKRSKSVKEIMAEIQEQKLKEKAEQQND